jgi:hypothetical protein
MYALKVIGTARPHFIHEVPLHNVEVGVRCTVNAEHITGPIFYVKTISSDRHVRLILQNPLCSSQKREDCTHDLSRIHPTVNTALTANNSLMVWNGVC